MCEVGAMCEGGVTCEGGATCEGRVTCEGGAMCKVGVDSGTMSRTGNHAAIGRSKTSALQKERH